MLCCGTKQTAERLFYTAQFDSLYLEGLCYLQTDSILLAQNRLEACAQLQPKSAATAYQLATVYALQKDTLSCIKQLKKAVKYGPNNYFYYSALAEMYVAQNNYKQAAKVYQTITQKFPEKDYPLYTLSRCYSELGQYDKSVATYQKLEERIGITAEMSLEKSFVMALDGNWEGVEQEFNKLHEKFPLDDDLYFREGLFYQSFLSHQPSLAIQCYEKAISLQPENSHALLYLCDLYERTGNLPKMEETLLRIFSAKSIEWSKKKELLTASYKYYYGKPQFEKMIDTIYQKMLLSTNDNEEIWNLYSQFLVEAERTEDAKEALQTCISILPTCELCHLQLLAISEQANQPAEYEQTLNQALRALPTHPLLLTSKANLLLTQKKEWQPYAQQALQAITDSTQANFALYSYNLLGELYGQTQQYDQAAYCLSKAYALDSTNNMTANNYAYYLALCQKDLDKAAAISEKTILAEPLNSAYLHTYAYILMLQNQWQKAEFYMGQAVEYDQKTSYTIYYDYGQLLLKLGKTEQATPILNTAKEIQQHETEPIQKD